MKKNLIALAFVLLSMTSARAQQLQDTYWTVYTPSGAFFQYFHLGFDSLFFSYDNVNYIWRSYFTENGSLFVIHDNDGPGQCSPADTGWYTFTILNDTLDFTLINDQCPFSGRPSVLGTYFFVRLYPTGIESPDATSGVLVYPNPSADGIFNLRCGAFEKILVYDAQGRKVFEETVQQSGQNHSINLGNLSQGVYFLEMQNQSAKKVVKITR